MAEHIEHSKPEELPVSTRRGDRPRPLVPPKPRPLHARLKEIRDVSAKMLNVQIPRQKRHNDTVLSPGGSKDRNGQPVPPIIKRSPTLPPNNDLSPEASSVASTEEDDFSVMSQWHREGFRPSALRHEYLRGPALTPHVDDIDIFPKEIMCRLSTTFDGKPYPFRVGAAEVSKDTTPFPKFKWFEMESYDKIRQRCNHKTQALKDRLTQDKPNRCFRVYLRHGSCCVKGTNNLSSYDPDTSSFAMDTMHEVAIKQICKFIATFPNQRFELVIYCDYGSIQEKPANGTYRDLMLVQYHEKLKIPAVTVKGQHYISNADIDALTAPEISDCLIDEATDCGGDHEKKLLKGAVAHHPAQTLLAVCVFERISLRRFQHFLDVHKLSDSNLVWYRDNCEDPDVCHVDYQRMESGAHIFFAHKIEEDRWFHERGPTEVVPISKVSDETIGDGAFSEVWEVRIDITHRAGQSLSSDLSRTYALKKFKETNTNQKELLNAFRKEIRMLLYLAMYPHPHILTHITSWEQEGKFYILYDKAAKNLRAYMKDRQAEGLTKSRMLWFLRQLHGLADAVRKVHQLREPTNTDISPILTPSRDRSRARRLTSTLDDTSEVHRHRPRRPKKTGIVGYHHDIKPENILAFDRPGQYPIFKLSDFGAGKFSSVRKQAESGYATSKANGTPTYRGPEKDMNMKMTRPFDMWALGCVFLELILWFLDIPQPLEGKSFATLRQDQYPINEQLDLFWQRRPKKDTKHRRTKSQPQLSRSTSNIEGLNRNCKMSSKLAIPDVCDNFIVNKAVKNVLLKLRFEWCKDMLAFLNVIDQIEGLLKIRPSDRLDAMNLANNLDAILAQAEVDLTLDEPEGENFYSQTYRRNRKPPEQLNNGTSWNGERDDAPSDETYGLPAQFSIAQPPGADVSTTGTSRRRSLHDLFLPEDTDPDGSILRDSVSDADHQGMGSRFTEIRDSFRESLRMTSGDESAADTGSPTPAYLRNELSHPLLALDTAKTGFLKARQRFVERKSLEELEEDTTPLRLKHKAPGGPFSSPTGYVSQRAQITSASTDFVHDVATLTTYMDQSAMNSVQWTTIRHLVVKYFGLRRLNLPRDDGSWSHSHVKDFAVFSGLLGRFGVTFRPDTTEDELLAALSKRETDGPPSS